MPSSRFGLDAFFSASQNYKKPLNTHGFREIKNVFFYKYFEGKKVFLILKLWLVPCTITIIHPWHTLKVIIKNPAAECLLKWGCKHFSPEKCLFLLFMNLHSATHNAENFWDYTFNLYGKFLIFIKVHFLKWMFRVVELNTSRKVESKEISRKC